MCIHSLLHIHPPTPFLPLPSYRWCQPHAIPDFIEEKTQKIKQETGLVAGLR
jgi:hypothetical protein